MASPPPYSTLPSNSSRELGHHNGRTPDMVVSPAPSDATTPSTVSSDATLPGYPTPTSSEARWSGSIRKADKRSSFSSSLASSEAVRRLRDAEEEVQRLRELTQRLRYEGSSASGLSPTRIKQLREDARASSADARGRKATSGLFKQACSTDLLFLIDTTASMSGHINAAKEQVKEIVNDILFAFLGEAEIRIAVVGYKDHGDIPNIEALDFTTDANRVRSFIDALRATGGNDTPEDMLGGIRRALNSTWMNQSKVIIHIADAPPHGRVNHDLSDASDTYATPGSEPHALHYEPLITQMVALNINYALLRINNYTDRTALNFLKVYLAAGAEVKLHLQNKYYSEAVTLTSSASSSYLSSNNSLRSARAKLQFEETELGTSYEKLRHIVRGTVTSSASRTAMRLSAGSTPRKSKYESKLMSTGMDAIAEDEDNAAPPEVKLETIPPRWDSPIWLHATLKTEGFSPDVGVHGASTLNDMMEDDENINMSITELTIKKRHKPFAQGAMRVAAYARTKDSTNKFVVKSFKKNGKKLAHLAEDMRVQALCKAFALEFSALVGPESSLDFIVTTCLRGKARRSGKEEHLSLEPFIEGTYIKYQNNAGWTNKELVDDPINQAAQAFSHFTFERSRGQFLVSDLQGVGRLLTDPAVHTKDVNRFKLSDPNLNAEGFKFFFMSHDCNDICRQLKLQSSKAMFVSGTFTFREDWPSMDNVACCSNKLCGKILQLATAKSSPDFEGHHWCDQCFPQLESTNAQLLCLAPGPQHEFKASRFFYESQGRNPPRLCPEHRSEDVAGVLRPEFNASTAVVANSYRSIPYRPTEVVEDSFPHSPGTASSNGSATILTPPESPYAGLPTPLPTFAPVLDEPSSFTLPEIPSAPPLPTEWTPRRFSWTAEDEIDDSIALATSTYAPYTPYSPYSPTSVAKTRKRNEATSSNPAATSRLSLTSGGGGGGGGFWSKLKKRSLVFKPSVGRLGKKD